MIMMAPPSIATDLAPNASITNPEYDNARIPEKLPYIASDKLCAVFFHVEGTFASTISLCVGSIIP